MKKSLASILAGIGLLIGLMFMVMRKGALGAGLILVVMCGLLLVVTFLSELWKLIYGKKVQDRNRHP